ncbi:MAG: glutamate racemase [Planctomycetota bacterium]
MKRPIAVFDSGIGGLTVLSEIRLHLPGEDLVYFGDTARVPYGTKSASLITRYTVENGRFLKRFDPKMFVVACNSMSSVALQVLEGAFNIPVVGVIIPGAQAAVAASKNLRIGVIATPATIRSKAYHHAVRSMVLDSEVFGQPCPLLVPAIEEGRGNDDPILLSIVSQYLAPLQEFGVDTLILGCTHYPLIKRAIGEVLGPSVTLVDSAKETAHRTRDSLKALGLLNPRKSGGKIRCFVSDSPDEVERKGRLFMGSEMPSVELAAPEQF